MAQRAVSPMWILAGLIACLLSVPQARGEDHTQDSLEQVMQAVKDKKAVVVDVREKSEWDRGHLKNAKLLPLSGLKKGSITVDEIKKTVPKEVILYVHCGSGYRCLEAAPLLRKAGYDVRPLAAGYKDLLKAGFPQAEPVPDPKDPRTK